VHHKTPRSQPPIPDTLTRLPSGSTVHVRLDDGSTITTRTRSDPWQLGHGAWVVMLDGRTGGYDLSRVRLVAETAPGVHP
jgi:hypothetical protein